MKHPEYEINMWVQNGDNDNLGEIVQISKVENSLWAVLSKPYNSYPVDQIPCDVPGISVTTIDCKVGAAWKDMWELLTTIIGD